MVYRIELDRIGGAKTIQTVKASPETVGDAEALALRLCQKTLLTNKVELTLADCALYDVMLGDKCMGQVRIYSDDR